MELIEGLDESALPVPTMPVTISGVLLSGRILLAEDGRDNQRLLTTHLRDAGAEVTVAENGQIAVEMVASQPFDLVLMDMQMPEMDGYTAAAELRRLGFTLPIVALTANAMSEDRTKCLDSGCSDYLTKPVHQEMLLRTVAHHLGQIAPVQMPPVQGTENAVKVDHGGTISSTMTDNPSMKAIIDEFVGGLPAEVSKLIDLMNDEDLLQLRRAVHQLRGSGGGYGFDAITDWASKVEGSINAADIPQSIHDEVNSLIDIIRRTQGYNQGSESLTTKEIENV